MLYAKRKYSTQLEAYPQQPASRYIPVRSIMRILITGAAGFVGQLLAKKLLDDQEGKYTLVLTDIVEPPIPKDAKWPQNAKAIKADLSSGAQDVVDKDLDAVFVFHGVMSSGSEANFDLGESPSLGSDRKPRQLTFATGP